METIKLTTAGAETRHSLEYWIDVICASFVELECVSLEREGFFGSIENTTVGEAQLSNIRAAPQRVSRNAATIGRSDRDYFLLSLQTAGRGLVEQDGRQAALGRGDFTLYDTTRPYDLRFDDGFGQIVLRLPRQMILQSLPAAEKLTAIRIQGGTGAGLLASTFLGELQRQVACFGTTSALRYHAVIVDLIAAALSEQVEARAVFDDARHLLQVRIARFIDDNLRDAGLTCEIVAERHRISERYLRKVFAGAGFSVAEMIWEKRLTVAKRDLCDPLRSHLSVSSIAFDVGFKDTGHFSRAFKAKFGVTPRAMRAARVGATTSG